MELYPATLEVGQRTWQESGLDGGRCWPHFDDGGWVHIFGDASGGANASSPRLRRIGVGLVRLPWLVCNIMASLALNLLSSEEQEVGRGETVALLEACRRTTCNLRFTTDRLSVYQGWHGKVWRQRKSKLQTMDLWWEVGQHAEAGNRAIQVFWVESHADEAALQAGHTPQRSSPLATMLPMELQGWRLARWRFPSAAPNGQRSLRRWPSWY